MVKNFFRWLSFVKFVFISRILLKFITYQTPSKFFDEFDSYYSVVNLKQVKVVSGVFFTLSVLIRAIAIIFNLEAQDITAYNELSISNCVQIVGSLIFLLASKYALSSAKTSKRDRKIIVMVFVMFVLTMSFGVSYILSLYNAKNMLFMFLVGVATVSLFFALELSTIVTAVIYIVALYVFSLLISDLPSHQKLLNVLAAVVLGIILFSFSRYSYCFKSQHFVKIKELEEKNLEIIGLNSQKGEILSFVAHDLRAPLNNIEALSTLMLLDNQANREAKMIVDAAAQAKNIINDLIEAAKQDHLLLPTEPLVINEFLQHLATKWEVNTGRKINLVTESEPVLIDVNASKLERVIDNLISNALKFSAPPEPIELAILKRDRIATIKVSDKGIGIPQHLQAHIFEQFSKAGREGLLGEKSIGLGLHISQKILEEHRGELIVESEENVGTTFTIQLPLA